MPLPTLPTPPSRNSPTTFADVGDTFLGALPAWGAAANALETNVNAKEASATASALAAAGSAAAAGAVKWTNVPYVVGDVRFSPIDGQTYRRIVAGTTNTDPSADATNWVRVNLTPQTGGAQETTGSASIVLTSLSSRVQGVAMTAQLLSVTLPAATTLATGGPLYVIKNTGSYTFSVRDSAAGLLTALTPGQCAAFYLSNNSTAAGTWAVGNHSVAATLYPGIVTTINAVASTAMTVVALSTTQAIAVYNGASFRARTLNINGNAISMGAEFVVESSNPSLCFGLCMMSSTQAIVTYVLGSILKACTLNVSGTTITAGAILSPTTTAMVTGATVTALSSTAAVIAYQQITSNFTHAMTLAVSGTTLTNGTESTGTAMGGGGSFAQIVTLSSTLCLMAWGQGGSPKVATVTISGTSATINTVLTALPSSNSVGPGGLVALSATQAVVAHLYSAANPVSVSLLAISGTTVTVTSTVQISGDNTNYCLYGSSLAKVSATQCAMLNVSGLAGASTRTLLLTVVGSNLVESSKKDIPGPIAVLADNSPQLAALSPTQLIAIYGGVSSYPVATTLEIAP